MEIGCKHTTVQAFEWALKAGKFDHEKEFIDRAMPYMQRMKQEIEEGK